MRAGLRKPKLSGLSSVCLLLAMTVLSRRLRAARLGAGGDGVGGATAAAAALFSELCLVAQRALVCRVYPVRVLLCAYVLAGVLSALCVRTPP